MNIFILDKGLKENAQAHMDVHVRKQILEAAQMACTVHHLKGDKVPPYRATHRQHPLVQWGTKSLTAYKFIVRYGLALCEEYTFRFGKTHKTEAVLNWLKENEPSLPSAATTYLPVVSEDCLIPNDVVGSYRKYYLTKKRELASWTNRTAPDWWK